MGLRRGRFIVLRCAHPWIITAVSTVVSTPTLTATRKRPGRLQAMRLQCFYHWRVTDVFTAVSFTAAPPCPPPREVGVDGHCLPRCSLRFPWMRDKGSRRGRFIVLRRARPWIVTAVSFHWMFPHPACALPHAYHNPQPNGQIAVCRLPVRGTCLCDARRQAQTGDTSRRWGSAPLMAIACPTFSSLDERQGIKQWRFIV